MNKQEVIEKIEELKQLSCGALGYDWISLGIDKALDVIKQLDEPDKPVLSKEEGNRANKVKRYEVYQKRTGVQLGIQQENGSMKIIFTREELTEYGFNNLDEYEFAEVTHE